MPVIDTIKADLTAARKRKDSAVVTTLSTLYAEAVKIGKDDGDRDPSDREVYKVIKRFCDNLAVMRSLQSDPELIKAGDAEAAIVSAYLPEPLTPDEIKDIVIALGMSGMREQKAFLSSTMTHFSNEYPGRYAPSELIDVIRRHIANDLSSPSTN